MENKMETTIVGCRALLGLAANGCMRQVYSAHCRIHAGLGTEENVVFLFFRIACSGNSVFSNVSQ